MSISMKKTMCALLLVICLSCAVALGLGSNSVAYAESNTAVPASETLQSGLGMAINVVTAQELNDYEFGHMVFDSEKLQNLSTSRVDLMGSKQYVYSTTDIDELIDGLGWRPHHLLRDSAGQTYLCTTEAQSVKATKKESTSALTVLGWAVKWLMAFELVLTGDLSMEDFNAPGKI